LSLSGISGEIMYKTCSKCREQKLLIDFHKDCSCKDGYKYSCKICLKQHYVDNKEQFTNYYNENREQILVARAKYRDENKIKLIESRKQSYLLNRDKFVKAQRKYRDSNPEIFSAKDARRRAAKLRALPKWLTKAEHEQIKELYEVARMFKLYTGQEYHVDHIVPLQGDNVCGLHVPWNLQVIPARENIQKSNKLQEDTI
jgi:hypothetical protein